MRGWDSHIFAYGTVPMLAAGATLAAPDLQMGMGVPRLWIANGLFVAGVWLSGFLLSPVRLGAALAVSMLACAAAMGIAIGAADQKLVFAHVWLTDLGWPSGFPAGPFELAAFALAALLLVAGLRMRDGRRLDVPGAAWVVILAAGVALAATEVVQSLGSSMLDPLGFTGQAYLAPLAVSGLAALAWTFIRSRRQTGRA